MKRRFLKQEHVEIRSLLGSIYGDMKKLSTLVNHKEIFIDDVKPAFRLGKAVNAFDFTMRRIFSRDKYHHDSDLHICPGDEFDGTAFYEKTENHSFYTMK